MSTMGPCASASQSVASKSTDTPRTFAHRLTSRRPNDLGARVLDGDRSGTVAAPWIRIGYGSHTVKIAQSHQERARRRRRLSSGAPVSAHLSGSARRTEARPVGYRSLASERCFRATSRRRTTLRSPNSRLGRGNVDRHRDRGNDDEIVHALAVHRAECADDQLCERGQERTRQEQPKSRARDRNSRSAN